MSDSTPQSPTETSGTGSGWSEPPWCGWIETTGDALLILEAARRGLIPRVTRRLVDSERKMITSGSVFVFDEDESGIKRWTDGFVWSPSRILGNFLIYRETNKRATVRGKTLNEPESQIQGGDGYQQETGSTGSGLDKHRERLLMGSLTNGSKFKPDGMIKKTFSLTIGGVSQHLISYYKVADVENGRLRAPSSLPELASLEISPVYLEKTHFRQAPRIEVGVDGIPRYMGEAEDTDSPGARTASGNGESSSSKQGRRYEPYSNATPKKPRKIKGNRTAQAQEDPGSSLQDKGAEPRSTEHSDGYTYSSGVGYSPYSYPSAFGLATSQEGSSSASYSPYMPYYWPPAYVGGNSGGAGAEPEQDGSDREENDENEEHDG